MEPLKEFTMINFSKVVIFNLNKVLGNNYTLKEKYVDPNNISTVSIITIVVCVLEQLKALQNSSFNDTFNLMGVIMDNVAQLPELQELSTGDYEKYELHVISISHLVNEIIESLKERKLGIDPTLTNVRIKVIKVIGEDYSLGVVK